MAILFPAHLLSLIHLSPSQCICSFGEGSSRPREPTWKGGAPVRDIRLT